MEAQREEGVLPSIPYLKYMRWILGLNYVLDYK